MSAQVIKVMVLSRHPDSEGGVVNYLELMKSRLSGSVRAVTFIIGRRPGENSLLVTSARFVSDLVRFCWLLSRNRYDVIHLNPTLDLKSTLRDSLFLLAIRLFRYDDRALIFFRGWDPSLERRLSGNALLRTMFLWLFGNASAVLVLATRFRDSLIRMGFPSDRLQTTTTMFDGRTLAKILDGPGRGEQPRTILFLSRFVKEKGVYELLEAFSRICDQFPGYELVMAGDGPEREGLREAAHRLGIEARVRFPGYIRGIEKARAFVSARVFVLATSYGEGLPNALLEALAAGNAVITTAVAGIPDVVQDPANGVILEQVTVEAIADAIKRLLADDEYYFTVRENNMRKAWSLYEADVATRGMERIYARIASVRGRP